MAKAKSKKITLEEALVPVEEQPYEVPENWCWVKLSYIADIRTGRKDANYGNEDGEYYLLNVNDLQELGMENPKDTYIVKYNTGEVINKTTPQNSKGKEIHLKGN